MLPRPVDNDAAGLPSCPRGEPCADASQHSDELLNVSLRLVQAKQHLEVCVHKQIDDGATSAETAVELCKQKAEEEFAKVAGPSVVRPDVRYVPPATSQRVPATSHFRMKWRRSLQSLCLRRRYLGRRRVATQSFVSV